ncbi:MAG: DUF1003 domain-containing protein [Microbacteriaceae bacterium]|nr:DUF1003 domain-containing protein [Microbacteriaceae bacterium]
MARQPHTKNNKTVPEQTERVSASERFGQLSEGIARAMGTPAFLVALSAFCLLWILWNIFAPEEWRFDSATIGFTALTLILSLQASYAAPLILLAQNRQDDRDRVAMEQDRQHAARNLADTEFLAREVVALRMAMETLPDREWLRAELRSLLAELEEPEAAPAPATEPVPQTGIINVVQNPHTGRLDYRESEDGNGTPDKPEPGRASKPNK